MKIAIIGGGLTGLTVAYYLSKEKNNKVFLFESSERLGGLAQSIDFCNFKIEPLYHHFFKTDTELIRLCEELEISNKITWNNSSIGLYWNKKLYPFMTPIELLKFPPLSILDKLRLGLTGIYLQKTVRWKKFTAITAKDWMRKYCGKRAYEVIWDPLLKGKFNSYYDKVSMAWLWARIHTRGKSKEKGDMQEKLGYFKGGFYVIIDALRQRNENQNVVIRLSEIVKKIVGTDNDRATVATNKNNYKFDKVIFTAPSYMFAKLIESNQAISQKYIEKLNSINYIGAITVLFATNKSLNPYYWVNVNDLKSPFLAFIEHTNLIPKENYDNKCIYYLGAYVPHEHEFITMDNKELLNKFFTYLNKIFPKFSSDEVLESRVFKFKNAQHIVDIDYKNKIPNHKTPIKNVYLANFSQIFPEDRGVNCAIREGKKIAKLIFTK